MGETIFSTIFVKTVVNVLKYFFPLLLLLILSQNKLERSPMASSLFHYLGDNVIQLFTDVI